MVFDAACPGSLRMWFHIMAQTCALFKPIKKLPYSTFWTRTKINRFRRCGSRILSSERFCHVSVADSGINYLLENIDRIICFGHLILQKGLSRIPSTELQSVRQKRFVEVSLWKFRFSGHISKRFWGWPSQNSQICGRALLRHGVWVPGRIGWHTIPHDWKGIGGGNKMLPNGCALLHDWILEIRSECSVSTCLVIQEVFLASRSFFCSPPMICGNLSHTHCYLISKPGEKRDTFHDS